MYLMDYLFHYFHMYLKTPTFQKNIKTNYVYIVRYKALARLYDTIISVNCGPEKMLSKK